MCFYCPVPDASAVEFARSSLEEGLWRGRGCRESFGREGKAASFPVSPGQTSQQQLAGKITAQGHRSSSVLTFALCSVCPEGSRHWAQVSQ